jgi:hypothetical protein
MILRRHGDFMAASARSERFVCESCGGEQTFDATVGRLKCAYCGAERDVPASVGNVVERDLWSGLATAARGLDVIGAKTSVCQECGAHVAFPDGVTATTCTFCGSPRVLEQEENRRALRPESLLPFAIDKKKAQAAFTTFLSRLWFRPSNLKAMAKIAELAGVYVPFWTYDAHVDSSWTAEAGYYYYVDEEYTTQENGRTVTKTRQVRHTRWEHAWGSRSDDYDDLLVCASQGLPRDLADRFKTFNMAALVPYSAGFLAGWRAEEYGVDLQSGFAIAKQRIVVEQERKCARDVPGDTHRGLRVENVLSDLTYKHVLLPVWIAAYRYNDKVYRFLVNGSTGEVVGKAPYSWVKITLAVLATLIVVIGLVLLLRSR